MKFNVLPCLAIMLFPTIAAAGDDPAAPVKEILGASDHNAAGPAEYEDYFSEDRLGRIYSRGFADLYRAAWKAQEADENSGYLLDADPILNAQDGCALKDLSIETAPERDGWTPVAARFKAFYCLNPDSKDLVTVVQFVVIRQGTDYVIDDIQHIDKGKVSDSLRQTLEILSK
jgi:hypothetical protein